jgi:transposase
MASRRAAPIDVSGRGTLWTHLRHAPLLVSKADPSSMSSDGHAGIYLAYAAVPIVDGELDTLILPHVNGDCMQIFLDEVAERHPNDRIVMVLDGAGWHQSHALRLPHNLHLLKLPPYSPELNPVEHLWDELREKSFHNRVFDSLDALENHLEAAMHDMEKDHERVHSIVAWPWIINSLMK